MKRIRELRGKLTQTELAEKIGVHQRNISFYELGTKTPPIDVLVRLADFFDVSVDYIIERTDVKELSKNVPENSQNSEKTDYISGLLFEYYNSLSLEAKKTIWQIIIMASQMPDKEKRELKTKLIEEGLSDKNF